MHYYRVATGMSYYYAGRSGDAFVGETLHKNEDCATLDGVSTRPIADSTVRSVDPDSVDWCPTCCDVTNDSDGTDDSEMHERDVAQLIDAGECPWCDDYEGEHVGRHASSAHPEEWAAHREG